MVVATAVSIMMIIMMMKLTFWGATLQYPEKTSEEQAQENDTYWSPDQDLNLYSSIGGRLGKGICKPFSPHYHNTMQLIIQSIICQDFFGIDFCLWIPSAEPGIANEKKRGNF